MLTYSVLIQSSIFALTVERMSGRRVCSCGVNRERTKSVSPIFRRRSSFPVPRRRRGKESVLSFLMEDFRPLFPPALPFSRKRIVVKGRLKSSQMIKMSSGGIL